MTFAPPPPPGWRDPRLDELDRVIAAEPKSERGKNHPKSAHRVERLPELPRAMPPQPSPRSGGYKGRNSKQSHYISHDWRVRRARYLAGKDGYEPHPPADF